MSRRVLIEPCEKCGEPDPMIEYAKRCHFPDEQRPDHLGEHFHVTCRRCGWWWAQRVTGPDSWRETDPDFINPARPA